MKHVKIDVQNNIQWVRLNRPEKRNAFHPEMIAELTQIFKKAAKSDLRAIVLTGEGESFCSGGDLEWMKAMADYTLKENQRDSENLYDMYETARICPIPVIGQIHGHAFGGGLGLVAVCDIVAAESKTQFCFSEVKWGLVPAVISAFVMEKMAPAKTREWMMTAKIFSAAEAFAGGLIHFQGDMIQVKQYVDGTIAHLRKGGPEALRETKKLLRFLEENPREKYRKETTRVIAKKRVGPEGQTGLKSFLEKKPTSWD